MESEELRRTYLHFMHRELIDTIALFVAFPERTSFCYDSSL